MSAFTEPNYEQQQNKIRQMVLAGLQQAQAEQAKEYSDVFDKLEKKYNQINIKKNIIY